MKKIASLIAISALTLGAASAQAQSLYGELAYQSLDLGMSSEPSVLRATIGHEYNANLAVEGVFGVGLSDGKDTAFGVPVKLKVDNIWGVYAKPKMKLAPALEVFGRVGVANLKATASATAGGFTAAESINDTELSYGFGATYSVTPRLSLSADFMKYDDVDALAFGVQFKF